MRVGQNPAKFIDHVTQPQQVTVAVVSYIPFLGGYYQHSLEVLKLCLESIWAHTDLPYDLLVFDNASCPEVRSYLQTQQVEGKIQYLILSDRNLGKGGAWNMIFAGAPGEYIAYADSDVYFHPGWLSALMNVLHSLPNVGMVTGAPLRIPQDYSTSTLKWGASQPIASVERGVLLSWEDWWKHAQSLGVQTEAEGRELYVANQDARLHYGEQTYYVGAAHFQFLAPKSALQSVLPMPTERPMGQVRQLDIAIDGQGYLRVCTPEWWVEHMGNTPPADTQLTQQVADLQDRTSGQNKAGFFQLPLVRRILVALYNRIFKILYQT